jgi:succinate dehydrogenase / fumarate reductase cytochrome b subunit
MRAVNSTAVALSSRSGRLVALWQSNIGRKVLMAITGAVLFGYVLVHMIGNLQVYLGPTRLNGYALALKSSPGLLWTVRAVLLASVIVHAAAGITLYLAKRRARPIPYVKRENIQASFASRTMLWSGVVILVFVGYHLLHLTTGTVHPQFREGDVYENVVTGFRVIPASIAYIIAMVSLGFHLQHGLYSMFGSVGVTHPRYVQGKAVKESSRTPASASLPRTRNPSPGLSWTSK